MCDGAPIVSLVVSALVALAVSASGLPLPRITPARRRAPSFYPRPERRETNKDVNPWTASLKRDLPQFSVFVAGIETGWLRPVTVRGGLSETMHIQTYVNAATSTDIVHYSTLDHVFHITRGPNDQEATKAFESEYNNGCLSWFTFWL